MLHDVVLFAVLPYAALAVGILSLVWHGLRGGGAQAGSASTESRGLERSVSWRWGLGGLLVGHLVGFLLPTQILAWNRAPLRLLFLEGVAFVFGGLAILGLILDTSGASRSRRREKPGAGSVADTVALTTLAVVLASGIVVAFTERWGSSWYAAVMVPYLRSLATFDPVIEPIVGLPFWARLHLLSALVLPAMLAPSGAGRRLVERLRALGSRATDRPSSMNSAETA